MMLAHSLLLLQQDDKLSLFHAWVPDNSYLVFLVFGGETFQGAPHDLDLAHIYVLEQYVHCGLAHGTRLLCEQPGQGIYCYSHQNNKVHDEDSRHQEHQGSNTDALYMDTHSLLSM